MNGKNQGNQDGDFAPGEETIVAALVSTAGPHLKTIAVPAGALLGTTRMQVVVRYFIAPDKGFVVKSVVVDGCSVKAVSSYTFPRVNTSHSIAVTFALDPPFPWKLFIPAITHGGVP